MPRGRKFSGPLVPGSRSVRGQGKNKTQTALKKAHANSALTKKEKKQVTKIAKNIVRNDKEIFHIMANKFQCETTLAVFPNYNQINPAEVFRSGGRISMAGLNCGESLSVIAGQCNSNTVYNTGGGENPRFLTTSGIRPLGLNGVSGQDIDGEYGYMKSFNQKLKIFVQPVRSTNEETIQDEIAPLNFRVLVVRVRTGNKASKFTPTLTGLDATQPSLFEDNLGNAVGLDSREVKTFEYENLRLNTQCFEKVRDINFQLQRPYVYANSNVALDRGPPKPAYKNISMNLPVPKGKIRYDAGTSLPVSGWNYVYYTMVFCSDASPIGGNDYATNVGWGMEALHTSKFQEA